MITITCDICTAKITGPLIRVELQDGQCGFNQNTMTRDVDVCPSCASKIPKLTSDAELSDVIQKINGKHSDTAR